MSVVYWGFDVTTDAGVCVERSGHQVVLAVNQTARGGSGLKDSLLESAIYLVIVAGHKNTPTHPATAMPRGHG